MKPIFKFLPILVMSAIAYAGATPSTPAEGEHEGPCKQIKEACEKAGFKKGKFKEGKGLWVDCIEPIMQGTTNKKSALSLPPVDSTTISACKTKHPKFGQKKFGAEAKDTKK